ncbi:MAG: hypothetical protein LCH56_15960 [Proteobacteria bacterium]|nr:hypothetical protein [Pseudomonadota bacterium]
MHRLALWAALGLLLGASALAQNAPTLPRWTFENEVSFYKPLKGECQLFYRDTVGFAGANMALTTCADDYRALWPAIEEATAASDKWILLQSIGDNENSAGARMRLIYHERDKEDWAFIDRGEPGKDPTTLAPRRARAAAMEKLFSAITKENQIDDPELAVSHAAATYITVFDGEAVQRKAFIRTAKSKLPAGDFTKLKALEDALWKLGPY